MTTEFHVILSAQEIPKLTQLWKEDAKLFVIPYISLKSKS